MSPQDRRRADSPPTAAATELRQILKTTLETIKELENSTTIYQYV